MMKRTLTCRGVCAALLLTVGGAFAAPLLEVTVTPSQPDNNFLRNADLTEHEADQPANWEFTTATPDNFEVGWSDEGRLSPGSLHILTRTGKMSGYWTQLVDVEPGAKLMVQAWARMTGGKLLVHLTGSSLQPDGSRHKFDQRYEADSMKQFFLAPLWIKREYLRGPDPDQWFLLHRTIEIPTGMDTMRVSLGSYFALGEMWLDDVYCGPAKVDVTIRASAASAADTDRITAVEMTSIPGLKLVRDADVTGPVANWTGTMRDLDASLDLVVRVKTADGKQLTRRVFPNPRGIH